MIKVTDYIAKRLADSGIRHIFMLTGGGAMHLNNSLGKDKYLKCVFNHHEQACAIAAEGYARISAKLGVVNVTSGPGGLNTLTGVMGQWTDSVPVLYISGQVKLETSISSCPDIGLRQLGDQEVDIVNIVKPITKFAIMVKNPNEIKRILDKAIYIATHGRPGPVWIDLPLDVQGAVVDESKMLGYDKKEAAIFNDADLLTKVPQVIKLIKASHRPVILAGYGIRIANAQELFLELVNKLKVPVLSTFNGQDLIASNHPCFIGRIGTQGDRAGNFALQNSDLLLSIGSRNNIRQVSYNWKTFAREAKKVVVDIDPAELQKSTLIPDIAVHSDARYFLENMSKVLEKTGLPGWNKWLRWCIERKNKYPVVIPKYKKSKKINPYYFINLLSECIKERTVVVTGNGTASVCYFQAAMVKKGQRIIMNSGCAAMGYDLPAAIGACFASSKKDIICITGDGSIQLNIQELQTIIHHKLPIKIFVLNNDGYISIRQTQKSFFGLPYVGSGRTSGLSLPDMGKIAKAYGIKSYTIDKNHGIRIKIKRILDCRGPVICEVKLDDNYKFMPKLSSERKPDGRIVSKPIEDMSPFLERKEFKGNMLVPLYREK
ncbi:MAG: thiamine pyrophosphate-binding protein [Candidatus Omnitrophota bacterium]